MTGIVEFDPSKIKSIAFDVDETLVHGTSLVKDKVWTEHIFPNRKEEIVSVNKMFDKIEPFRDGTYNQGDRIDRIAYMLDVWSVADSSFRHNREVIRLSNKFSEAVQEGILSKRVSPEDIETLRLLSEDKNYSLYVASNVPEESLRFNIKHYKIDHFFNDVIGMPVKKDEALRRIVKENKFLPENVLMVGDGEPDYAAADIAGTQFVGVVQNDSEKWKNESFPKIQKIKELRQILVL